MSGKNDARILELKEKIEKKREEIKKVKRFSPQTNCILELDGTRYNLNVLKEETLVLLLIKLNGYVHSAEDLGFNTSNVKISGFNMDQWVEDVKARLETEKVRTLEQELKARETQLQKLLSEDKRTEMALDEIESFLS